MHAQRIDQAAAVGERIGRPAEYPGVPNAQPSGPLSHPEHPEHPGEHPVDADLAEHHDHSGDHVELTVDFCGELTVLRPPATLTIGREADLSLDTNPYLHRHLLELAWHERLWWLRNIGTRIAATLSIDGGVLQAWLSPGASVPIMFSSVAVVFSAGPSTYELRLSMNAPRFAVPPSRLGAGDRTMGEITLTVPQRRLVLALAEPMLRAEGGSITQLPSSREAADRLGVPLKAFNRKLDQVCEKLARLGVDGLRGEPGALALQRRARLVEFAVGARLITANDLHLLDEPPSSSSGRHPPAGRPA